MNQPIISIAIDAMGGDNSPSKVIEGCEIFLNNNNNVKLFIFGDTNSFNNHLFEKYPNNITIIHCDEIILDNDKPSSVLRSKKESSMAQSN